MKKISLWAKGHVLITRIIISIIHILLVLNAFYLSKYIDINFSFSAFMIITSIIIVAVLLYPFAKRISYSFQKITLFITSTCFFLITCFFFKHNFNSPYFQKTLSAVSLPVDSLNKRTTSLTKVQKHFLKKELRKEIKAYKKLPKAHRPTAQDALLIFLLVLSGVGLLFGLSILICGISCGGVPALAVILTLLGMGGIGVGVYFLIRKLHKNIEHERSQDNTMLNDEKLMPALVMF